ncbi:CgeB family protein [Haloferula sp.]|uniref:CgeB family protein n=1 Tax=Haloferula sp. TaxID=2497595 RepID=UPI003C76B5FA
MKIISTSPKARGFSTKGIGRSRGVAYSSRAGFTAAQVTGKNQPRVVILGKGRSILTWFEDLRSGFDQVGAEVRAVSIQAETGEERWLQKREGLRELDNPRVIERIRTELEAFAPDLIVVQNKAGLPAAAFERWVGVVKNAKWVGWLCDNLNAPPKNLVACFHRVYYFDSGCVTALESFYDHGGHSFDYLPLAVNPERYPLVSKGERKQSIVFAGKCSPHRRAFFDQIREKGLPLEVYGPGCGDWLRPWRGRRLSSGSLAKLYAGHIASLNLLQPGNTERGMNLRAFEAPCCGGVGLYPAVEDLPRCFEAGKEILVYENVDALAGIVDELVGNPERVNAVAEAGRARVLAEHTFKHRAQRMLADLAKGGG